jgi:hypothetical protein
MRRLVRLPPPSGKRRSAEFGKRSIVDGLPMLIFFDETFRDSLSYSGVSFGALCGIAIPENELHRIATDIFQLKLKHFGSDFARDGENQGQEFTQELCVPVGEK